MDNGCLPEWEPIARKSRAWKNHQCKSRMCGKCDGWPLVEKVLEAVAPHPYNASLRLCAQRWIHPGAWQDGVAA